MNSIKKIANEGWHPDGKKGSRDSKSTSTWRKDYKGLNQVAGWMGRPEKAGDSPENHVSRPLSSLKDPSLFGPPPKNVNYHGGAALPNEITPSTSGWGAPMTQEQINSARQATSAQQEYYEEEEEPEPQKPAPPPTPYRADRTGLRTDHLPPPPVRRDLQNSSPVNHSPQPPARPNVPPRAPARHNPEAIEPTRSESPPPPPAYNPVAHRAPAPQAGHTAYVNQGALDRLKKANVNVPALGIGSPDQNPWQTEQSQSPVQSPPLVPTNSHPKSPPAQGTTWEQKQSAIRTASNFHKNPSSVTMADARAAASTANNFRERHQETIAAGAQKASAWNKKYNLSGRVGAFLDHPSNGSTTPSSAQTSAAAAPALPLHPNHPRSQQTTPLASPTAPVSSPPLRATTSNSSDLRDSIARKAPPPPPPKKPGQLHGNPNPPPIPTGTRPSMP